MRFSSAGLLSVMLLVSQLSVAGAPSSSPQQLGAVQAAIDFCSKIDPANVKRIEQQARMVLPDMTEARVAAARHDTEFQKTYQIIASVLAGLGRPDATRVCGAFPQKGPPPPHHHNPDR